LYTCMMHVLFYCLLSRELESEKIMAAKCAYVEKIGAVFMCANESRGPGKGGWKVKLCACPCGRRTGHWHSNGGWRPWQCCMEPAEDAP